jgi:hypothetical protein
MLFYAIAGYFGTPSFSSRTLKIETEPGPDDGPIYVIRLKTPPIIDPEPIPRPNWQVVFAKFSQPDPYPMIWSIGTGLVGGFIGGFVGNFVFPENPVFAIAGAVFGGRIAHDAVSAVKRPTPRYF